jgi:hypothetical protein
VPFYACTAPTGSLSGSRKSRVRVAMTRKWAPAAKTPTAANGILRAVMSDDVSAHEPEHARGGRSVRAGDGGPSLPIIVEPLKQPTEVPAPPAPQEPVREPEKVPA